MEDMKMKITMSKLRVPAEHYERVRADMAEFRRRYRDSDIIMAFNDLGMGRISTYKDDLVYMNLEAMDSGDACGNVTVFSVEFMVESHKGIVKVNMYVDMYLEIDQRELDGGVKMLRVRHFTEV